jgi:hypothetical protein
MDHLELAESWAKKFPEFEVLNLLLETLRTNNTRRYKPGEILLEKLESVLGGPAGSSTDIGSFKKWLIAEKIGSCPEGYLEALQRKHPQLKDCDSCENLLEPLEMMVEADVDEFNAAFETMTDFVLTIEHHKASQDIAKHHHGDIRKLTIIAIVVSIIAVLIPVFSELYKDSRDCGRAGECAKTAAAKPDETE